MRMLHDYLQDTFHNTIATAVPQINARQYTLHFILSQNDNFDISTPVACQLAPLCNSVPADLIAQTLLSQLNPDAEYITDRMQVLNGFINFCISPHYLNRILLDTTQPTSDDTSSFNLSNAPIIMQKFERLLMHADSLHVCSADEVIKADCQLLTTPHEHRILILLAMSNFPTLRSGHDFYNKKLLDAAEKLYMNIPILCKDGSICRSRILLVKKTMEKLKAHLH